MVRGEASTRPPWLSLTGTGSGAPYALARLLLLWFLKPSAHTAVARWGFGSLICASTFAVHRAFFSLCGYVSFFVFSFCHELPIARVRERGLLLGYF